MFSESDYEIIIKIAKTCIFRYFAIRKLKRVKIH